MGFWSVRHLKLVWVLFIAVLSGCASTGPVETNREDVERLAVSIQSLGPEVDPIEAQRAAEIAYSYTRQLAIAYEIEDPPLLHNFKVNRGLKPRGLCWHWAEDMEARLNQEGFETLQMHRAIANADNPFLIDHSTAIVSARGDRFEEGIVLDPWRYGGTLFWAPPLEDKRFVWVERHVVFAQKRARRAVGGWLSAAVN